MTVDRHLPYPQNLTVLDNDDRSTQVNRMMGFRSGLLRIGLGGGGDLAIGC